MAKRKFYESMEENFLTQDEEDIPLSAYYPSRNKFEKPDYGDCISDDLCEEYEGVLKAYYSPKRNRRKQDDIKNNYYDYSTNYQRDHRSKKQKLQMFKNHENHLSIYENYKLNLANTLPNLDTHNLITFWKQVISYFENDKATLSVLRLCCRKFRTIVNDYWVQYVPSIYFFSYSQKCTKFKSFPTSVKFVENCNEIIQTLKNFTSLKEFQPPKTISNQDLALIAQMNQLTSLNLENVIDIDIKGFSQIPSTLTKLNLKGCRAFDYECFNFLPPNLTELDLSCNPNVDDSVVHFLPYSLTKLVLDETNITSSGLEHLPPSLEELSILKCSRIDESGIKYFPPKAKVYYGLNKEGEYPLIYACQSEDYEAVKVLLSSGVDPNIIGSHCGVNPLFISLLLHNRNIMKLLVEHKADLNQKVPYSPLHSYKEKNKRTCFNSLPKETEDKSEEIKPNYNAIEFSSLLYFACETSNHEMFEMLLENGADVNSGKYGVVDKGITPLYISCLKGNLKFVQILVQKNCNIDQGREDIGSSPLHVACSIGNESIVKVLLENGANVNKVQVETHSTPLVIACQKENITIIKLLLAHNANPTPEFNLDENFSRDVKMSPFLLACLKKNEEMISLLLQSNLNLYQVFSDGQTLFEKATSHLKSDTTKNLMDLLNKFL